MKRNVLLVVGLLLVGILLGITGQPYAGDYYVAYETGSDGSPGTKTSPRKTIPSSLSPGDVVYLKRGETYSGSYIFANSGTEKIKGTNGVHTAGSATFTSSGSNFTSSGVTTTDKVFINGEGWFSISAVGTTTLTLSTATKHTNTGVAFAIGNLITITIDETWGSGSAYMVGGFTSKHTSWILIDGVVDNGIDMDLTGNGVYANNASTTYGTFIRNIRMHDNNSNGRGVYMRNAQYVLVDNCTIENIGIPGSSDTGGDGIGGYYYYLTVKDCTIEDTNDDGLHFDPAFSVFVQNTTIENVGIIDGVRSGDTHPDAFATNSGGAVMGPIVVRYCMFKNNRVSWDMEKVQIEIYFNVFTNDGVTNTPENHSLMPKLGSTGLICNNIFAWDSNAITMQQSPDSGWKVMNNIFYENAVQTDELTCTYESSVLAPANLRNNLYVRKVFNVRSGDNVIGYSGVRTLTQVQSLGADLNSIGCFGGSVYGCDWPWQNPYLFKSEARASADFHPYSSTSPQIGAGVVIPELPAGVTDIDGVVISGTPSIGAYQGVGNISLWIVE